MALRKNLLGLTSQQFYGAEGNALRTVYRGKVFTIKAQGLEAALAKLKLMRDGGDDLTAVFNETIGYYKQIIRGNYNSRITPDAVPQRWVKLSARYAKWKKKNYGRKVADLVLTGTLKNAVWGGPGWFEDVSPTVARFGIQGIDYAAVHQFGYKKIPARRYMLDKNDKFPPEALNHMVDTIIDHLKGAF